MFSCYMRNNYEAHLIDSNYSENLYLMAPVPTTLPGTDLSWLKTCFLACGSAVTGAAESVPEPVTKVRPFIILPPRNRSGTAEEYPGGGGGRKSVTASQKVMLVHGVIHFKKIKPHGRQEMIIIQPAWWCVGVLIKNRASTFAGSHFPRRLQRDGVAKVFAFRFFWVNIGIGVCSIVVGFWSRGLHDWKGSGPGYY